MSPRTLAELPPAAYVDGDVALTHEDAAASVDRIAAGLTARGVRAGDVVAFHLPNVWQAALLFFSCWRIGAVAGPLHPRLTRAEVEGLLTRLSPALTIRTRDEADTLIDLGTREVARAPRAPDDLALILATSGSSGPSKLVHHADGALAYKAHTMVAAHGLTSDDVVLMPAPLAHVSGALNGVLLPAAAGMRVVLMERWDPRGALTLIERERVTFMIGPPTFFIDLMAAGATPDRTASLRLISTGGASVTPAFVERAAASFGCVVKRTYGSTEAPTVTTWQPGDPPALARDTDGRAVGAAELRIVRPGTEQDGAAGEVGEVLVRGPELFVRYDDEDATASAFTADGWFRTGDVGRLDDGWLTIIGRLGDTIIRGGENIAPAEVEQVCVTLPGAAAVAVGAYPDERLGQRVALVVVAAEPPPLSVVQEHCERAGLARYKWPERVVAVDALPLLAAGKPDRAGLASLLTAASDLDT